MPENEVVAPATETPVTPVVTKVIKPRASTEQFCEIWNASESRKDVIARLAAAGYVMTYSAVVARAKTYKDNGIALKDIPHADKGKRIDVAAVNAKLAAAAQPVA